MTKKLSDYQEDKKKVVKVYFCPKCGSKEIGFIFRLENVFGVIPKMECKKCKFKGGIFPLLVVDRKSLKKQNSKSLSKLKKRKKK